LVWGEGERRDKSACGGKKRGRWGGPWGRRVRLRVGGKSGVGKSVDKGVRGAWGGNEMWGGG